MISYILRRLFACGILLHYTSILHAQVNDTLDESYRPKIHFTPEKHWMNDPNGLVYSHGYYHLFFQYHPYSSVWGPMHWGHAVSRDLVHWKREPIALYPDSIGMIFSGSAVVDKNNTSALGTTGSPPLVAIFTQHDAEGEKQGRRDFQNQSLAYSLDDGKTWLKYKSNPVLKNPGVPDFRDPKVTWYPPQEKWIMALAVKNHINFYSSRNLKNWIPESEFGKQNGAHGGVWECPDLFPLDDNGKKIWVLIVNLNPGGPNNGSATQYFLGDFDGKHFLPLDSNTRWLDYGPDEYAGVTWSNTGSRKIFLGWMSNWLYANVVPTETWRNAMTLPRELKLKHIGGQIFIVSQPVRELSAIESKPRVVQGIRVSKTKDLNPIIGKLVCPVRLDLTVADTKSFSLQFANSIGENLAVGFDREKNQYFIDRSKSGRTDFQKDFAGVHAAPRFSNSPEIRMTLVVDVSSVELFADDGLSVMTEIFFPTQPYDRVHINSNGDMVVKRLQYTKLKDIWR